MKWQFLVDFIMEALQDNMSSLNEDFLNECVNFVERQYYEWSIFFDCSKCTHEARANIVLISLDNWVIPMTYRLSYYCTNNIAKYEALNLDLKAITLNMKNRIFKDFQLVVNQRFIIQKMKHSFPIRKWF